MQEVFIFTKKMQCNPSLTFLKIKEEQLTAMNHHENFT